MQEAGFSVPMRLHERLRDRELGVLDMLTVQGVAARGVQVARQDLGERADEPLCLFDRLGGIRVTRRWAGCC